MEETKVKLDLACGTNKVAPDFIGIDKRQLEGIDKVMDLEEYPWDIEDESVDEIFCSHYVQYTSDLIKFMDEVYRILKPGGTIKIVAPYYTSMRAIQDPTHKRNICEATFLYFNKQWREINKLDYYDIKSDFDFSYGHQWAADYINRAIDHKGFALKNYWNVVDDIHIVLTKRG